MEKKEADRLLQGGKDGIREWNALREHGAPVPDLSSVDLSQADLFGVNLGSFEAEPSEQSDVVNLKGANLSGANLRDANLNGTYLFGANLDRTTLEKAHLRLANLQGALLAGANLEGADLREALLKGAKLDDAVFKDTNLQDADLQEVTGLFGKQLAGSIVAGAKLPEEIKVFGALENIKDACSNARTIFLWILVGCMYAMLTIGTTSDAALITNNLLSPLPIIGAKIPIVGFYIIGPLILLGFYFYFHLCMQNIWERLSTLPAVLPDGRTLDKAADPWLLVAMVQYHFEKLKDTRNLLSYFQRLISILLAWYSVPLSLMFLWQRYLRAHDGIVSAFHILIVISSIIYGFYTYRRAVTTLTRSSVPCCLFKKRGNGRFHYGEVTTGMAVVFLIFFSWGAMQGKYWNAHLEGAELSIVQTDHKSGTDRVDRQPIRPANLTGINLRGASASGVFLVNANLSGADLRKADLRFANLAGADLAKVKLEGTRLSEANLTGCDLKDAVGLTSKQIAEACTDASTLLPEDLPPATRSVHNSEPCRKRWGG